MTGPREHRAAVGVRQESSRSGGGQTDPGEGEARVGGEPYCTAVWRLPTLGKPTPLLALEPPPSSLQTREDRGREPQRKDKPGQCLQREADD